MGTSVGWAKSELDLINPRHSHLALKISETEMTSLPCKGAGSTGIICMFINISLAMTTTIFF